MTQVRITTEDNETKEINIVGDWETVDSAIEAHGYDPETVDFTVKKDVRNRLEDLEQAAGVDGAGKTGIAQRIDDLEDRVADLESYHS